VVLEKTERFSEAEPLCRQAGSIWAAELPPGHRVLKLNANLLGAILCGLGRYPDAEPLLVESYQGLINDPGVRAVKKKEMLERLVHLYESWDAAEAGNAYAEQAAEYRKLVQGGS
jgi:hypothetical protein